MKQVTKYVAALWLLCGCAAERDPVRYAEDPGNGLRKEVQAGALQYEIQYKPAAYIVHMEHRPPAEAPERLRQLQGMAWFNISFRVKDFPQSPLRYKIRDLEEYTARQDYYLNQAPRDLYLLYGQDTLYTSSYWFENNQNLAQHETMVVGFRLPEGESLPSKDMRLSFYDRVFRNGIIKTLIRAEDLEDIPDFK